MEKRTDTFGKKAMGLHKISGRIAKGEGSGDDVSGEKRRRRLSAVSSF